MPSRGVPWLGRHVCREIYRFGRSGFDLFKYTLVGFLPRYGCQPHSLDIRGSDVDVVAVILVGNEGSVGNQG